MVDISVEYSINLLTLAIFPIITKKGELFSKIYEGDKIIICSLPPKEIIDRNCIELACTYEGKKNGTRALMNYSYKVPITIDVFCFFPTHSPSDNSCSWISIYPIVETKKIGAVQTNIIFENNVEITVPVSHHIITNQMSRSNALLKKVNYNREKKNSSSFLLKTDYKNSKEKMGKSCKEDNAFYLDDNEKN